LRSTFGGTEKPNCEYVDGVLYPKATTSFHALIQYVLLTFLHKQGAQALPGTMLAKCEQYHDWGVPYCWLVDPEKRIAWEYHSGREPEPVGDALHAGELIVRLDELFAELPK
jgi:Uma2 family endonuclease